MKNSAEGRNSVEFRESLDGDKGDVELPKDWCAH